MSQYTIRNKKGRWVVGWDRPLNSFFLQLHVKNVEPDDNPVIWLGADAETTMREIGDLVYTAKDKGLTINPKMMRTLQKDKEDGE